MTNSRFAVSPDRSQAGVTGNLIEVPVVRGDGSFKLSDLIGSAETAKIEATGELSFHAVGDTGLGANTEQQAVAEAMARDIDTKHPEKSPVFFFHLGDIIYGPGKTEHYPEKFYQPYADYHNYIVAIPGNHDGDLDSLKAYLANFCDPHPADAVRYKRKMPNQPGAYWHMSAPFLDLIGLFSNVDENIGSLKSVGATPDSQIEWLTKTLKQIAESRSKTKIRKALVIGTHHPPYSRGLSATGVGHPQNPLLVKELDSAFAAAGILPDAVLSGHSHNYQYYRRDVTDKGHKKTIPYLVCGTGGIGLQATATNIGNIVDDVTYVSAIKVYGYLTVAASATSLNMTFSQQANSHRVPLHHVSVDLATGVVR